MSETIRESPFTTISPDSTMEEFCQCILQHHKATVAARRDYLTAEYDKILEDAKREIMAVHHAAVAHAEKENEAPSPSCGGHRSDGANSNAMVVDETMNDQTGGDVVKPSSYTATTVTSESQATTTESSSAPRNPTSIRIEILTGPHEGTTVTLTPRTRAPCFIGRSTGKKFREKGICLCDDPEVSTTHAKFELKKGRFYYNDMGSTNGSYLLEGEGGKVVEDIVAGCPLLLEDGMVLKAGVSEMVLSFVF